MHVDGAVGAVVAPINDSKETGKEGTTFVPISRILEQVVAINCTNVVHCKRFVGPFNDQLMVCRLCEFSFFCVVILRLLTLNLLIFELYIILIH